MTDDHLPCLLSEQQARHLIDGIKADVTDLGDRIAEAYLGRAWEPLGYADWDALCDAEFDGARLRIPREQRAEQVLSLRQQGLSTRAIASALGVGKDTVHRDLATVADETDEGHPLTVRSLDGRTRPASQPPRPIKVTTTETTIVDSETGEVLTAEDWQARQDPVESPEARRRRERENADRLLTRDLAAKVNALARMSLAEEPVLRRVVETYYPDEAASFGGITRQKLQDAAAYLLALARIWKDDAA